VLNKYAMDHGPLEGAVYGYMYVQSIIAVFLIGGYTLYRGIGPSTTVSWVNTKMLKAVLLLSAAWLCHMIFKNYAMAFTANPSYQAALNLSTPVFIALFYMAAKHKEEAAVWPGMGIVACAVLLALASTR
jgi:prolipoprotein diacylglyceryltransferase